MYIITSVFVLYSTNLLLRHYHDTSYVPHLLAFKYEVGDFMILKDHIDWNAMTGRNPLLGPNDDYWGPRFVAMNDAYDRHLQTIGLEVGKELKAKCLKYFFEQIVDCR